MPASRSGSSSRSRTSSGDISPAAASESRTSRRLTDLEREWREQVVSDLKAIKDAVTTSSTKVEVLSTKVDLLEQRVKALETAVQDQRKDSDEERKAIDFRLWGLVVALLGTGASLGSNVISFILAHWH